MTFGTLGLAFLAGLVSVLAPCVLPLLPAIFAAAASEHRHAPLALAAGLALSFTVLGLFVALVGFWIGLDSEFFRAIAAVMLVAIGAVLVVPKLEAQLAVAAGPVTNWTGQRINGFGGAGLGGQFALGLILGAAWVPCVGPTLGAASLLASQGENLGAVAATMFVFGLGAAVPLALIGVASRRALATWRPRLAHAERAIKFTLGAVLLLLGTAILTGVDRVVETALVNASPAWLIDLTTRF